MEKLDLILLAKQAAGAHGLDPALVCAIAEQESDWNPWSIRYEPGFYARYVQPLVSSGQIKTATEAKARATSWGLGQCMGQTARELGFKGKYLSELCDPRTGLDMLCRVLKNKIQNAGGDIRGGLLRYNGGARSEYADEVLARVAKYRPGGVT